MTDLTAITTPFGLLDRETQEALKAHGGPYVFASPDTDWGFIEMYPDLTPQWARGTVYRVKPAPPKPREWWLYRANKSAEWRVASSKPHESWVSVHVREVLE